MNVITTLTPTAAGVNQISRGATVKQRLMIVQESSVDTMGPVWMTLNPSPVAVLMVSLETDVKLT